MKNTINIIILIISIFSTQLLAQGNFFIEGGVTPLIVSLDNVSFDKEGADYYSMDYGYKASQEVHLGVGRHLFNKKMKIGVGASLKNQKLYSKVYITEYWGDKDLLESWERQIDQKIFGIRLFTEYRIGKKMGLYLAVEANDPYSTVSNASERPSGAKSYSLLLSEESGSYQYNVSYLEVFEPSASNFLMSEVNLTWEVYKNLYLLVGCKYRLTNKDETIYSLRINASGETPTGGDAFQELTGSSSSVANRVSTDGSYLGVQLGAKYNFSF